MTVTSSMREYLAEIYRLQQYEYALPVYSNDLARRLSVSAPAVARMRGRLEEKGLIVCAHYGRLLLTETGQYEAAKGLRWHRILELFASEQLGVAWADLHAKARLMMKGVDDEIIERMAAMLGHPTQCPHGEYIPPADELMPELKEHCFKSLCGWRHGGVVGRIRTRDKEMKEQLLELGIVPGVSYRSHGGLGFFGAEPNPIEIGGKVHEFEDAQAWAIWLIPDSVKPNSQSSKIDAVWVRIWAREEGLINHIL